MHSSPNVFASWGPLLASSWAHPGVILASSLASSPILASSWPHLDPFLIVLGVIQGLGEGHFETKKDRN